MSVHQSPRRHSARLQNAYEDGTDEDEQYLLQPADKYDHQRVDYGRRSSPQDQHLRHTQLHTPVRKFADRQSAANDVPFGPNPDASHPAYSAGERSSGTEHADPTYSVGAAALPSSLDRSLPPAPRRPHTPFVQRSSDLVNDRPPLPAGSYYSDSPYPQPTTREAHRRLTPLELAALPLYPEADGQEWHPSHAAEQPTSATCRTEQRLHPQHNLAAPVPGGGRGLSSSPSEPNGSYADRERNSAFYRNAHYTRTTNNPAPSLPVLPELPIPKFSGDVRVYPLFRNRFLEAVEGRKELAPRHKFQYLLQYLEGEPLDDGSRYLITDENYFNFLDRLEDDYGDKQMLLTLLSQEFLDLEPVGQNVRDLRRFHDGARRLADEMKLAGEEVDQNTLWKRTLMSKLPQPLRLKVYERLGENCLSTPASVIMARLSDHLRILEASEVTLSWDAVISPAESHSEPSDVSDSSDLLSREDPELAPTEPAVDVQRVAAAVATTRAEEELRERRTCPLCGLLHSAADCTVYDTTKKRLRQVLKLHLCLLCLREGHPAVSCPRRTTRPCKICRHGQHNRALCKDVADDNNRNGSRPSPVRATKGSSFDPEASDPQRHSRTSAPATTSRRVAELSVNRDVTCFVATATTLRQSGTQSSRRGNSGNLINRTKRPKEQGTAPHGRAGTNGPPTTSNDESMKQKGADAYGGDRLLSGRYHPPQTDRCSNNREMMQFDRTQGDGSDGVPGGMPEEKFSRELYNDEDIPHQPFDGHCTDPFTEWSPRAPDEDRFPHYEESTVYVACASDSEQPAVLHECLAVTAMNPVSKKSCRAVLMFDSGSSSSHVSSKLANFLDLPHHEMRVQSVSTFGSKTPMAINGFRTFLILRSEHGRSLQVHVTALDCIVSSVRTALVRDSVLPALRRNDCTATTTREMPDLLIGQDLVHLFERQLEPTLPNGFYIVQTSMGRRSEEPVEASR